MIYLDLKLDILDEVAHVNLKDPVLLLRVNNEVQDVVRCNEEVRDELHRGGLVKLDYENLFFRKQVMDVDVFLRPDVGNVRPLEEES